MKLKHLAIIAGFLLRGMDIGAAEPLLDGQVQLDLESCKIDSPDNVKATTEIVPGETENSKMLKIVFGEEKMESWEGKLSQKFSVAEPGTYSITFLARVEPTGYSLELSVWAERAGKSARITGREHQNVRNDWTEIHFVLVTEQPEPDLTLSCMGLGHPGSTWFFTDFKLTKE